VLYQFCCRIREKLSSPTREAGGEGGCGQERNDINLTLDTSSLNATLQAVCVSVIAMLTSTLLTADFKKKEASIYSVACPNPTVPCSQDSAPPKDLRHEPPLMSDFLKSLLAEKNASHIATHMQYVTKNWKGMFIEGSFCLFLAKGYLSVL
jgi:hypothetical protein